jgi:hypothetical protein
VIYSIYWMSVYTEQRVTEWNKAQFPNRKVGDLVSSSEYSKELADGIKESENDTFLFLLSNYAGEQAKHGKDQKPQFDSWIKEHGLEEYVAFMSAGISNPAHQERKYSVYLVVMQSKNHHMPVEMKGMVK